MNDFITKPSIARLAKKAGVKSVSEDSYPVVQNYLDMELKNILRCIIILNEEQNTKTIMPDDVNKAFQMCGYNVAQSSELNSLTSTK